MIKKLSSKKRINKVGIVTLYRNNFGSILQAYSTYTFVEKLGYDCTILQLKYSKRLKDKIVKIPKFLYKCIRYKGYISERRKLSKAVDKEKNLLSKGTKKKMDDFIEHNFKIKEYQNRNLKTLNDKYDFFITGSDQVWNGYDKFRYLVFADKKKKIALAPSFGGNKIKSYDKKNIRKAIDEFSSLSAREESGVEIIRNLTGRNALRLPDPTIILNKNEWIEFAKNGIKKTNYILVHFLNQPNDIAIKVINEYLENHDCKVYCICNQYDVYNKLLRYEFIDVNPYDYVSLISFADFVFTDSFHSTLFSINLEIDFLTFDRQHFHGVSQRSRLLDLLNRVSMQYKFVTEDYENIIFEKNKKWSSDLIFREERDNIKNYIKVALNNDR